MCALQPFLSSFLPFSLIMGLIRDLIVLICPSLPPFLPSFLSLSFTYLYSYIKIDTHACIHTNTYTQIHTHNLYFYTHIRTSCIHTHTQTHTHYLFNYLSVSLITLPRYSLSKPAAVLVISFSSDWRIFGCRWRATKTHVNTPTGSRVEIWNMEIYIIMYVWKRVDKNYQYARWLYAMLVIWYDMIEEHQICLTHYSTWNKTQPVHQYREKDL